MALIEKVILLSGHSKFREQCYRLLQYLSSFLKEYYLFYNAKDYVTINALRRLETHISGCRKLLRLGKCLEAFKNAQQSINVHIMLDNFTDTLSHIAMGCYYIFDNIGWFYSIVLNSASSSVNMTATRFWLLSLSCVIARDGDRLYRRLTSSNWKCRADARCAIEKLAEQLFRNILDLVVALVTLKKIERAKIWAAACGVFSSMMGIRSVLLSLTVR